MNQFKEDVMAQMVVGDDVVGFDKQCLCAARELFELERHMARGGDYWEFMCARYPQSFLPDGSLSPSYRFLMGLTGENA